MVEGLLTTPKEDENKKTKHIADKWIPVRREFSGLERLTKEVRRITAHVLGIRGFSGADILESWSDIVGPDLSLGISPEKLTFERDNRTHGTLHVKSSGGAFAMLFEHQKQRVIERINCFLGYPAVSSIKIKQGRLFLKKPRVEQHKKTVLKPEIESLRQKVSIIENKDLREITYQIGLSLLKQKK